MGKAEQMSFLFEEGGIADDGMDRDPVSGNEVPSGSMAEEVRDDIPAQLSEGEYVVPADVVRYYGVRFFEELRSEAKEGLGDMESDGRIGGEPVGDYGDDMLSAEEESELMSITGMAAGGMASYDQPPPQAIGNAGINQEMTRGYQEGGVAGVPTIPTTTSETGSTVQFTPQQFPAGFATAPQPRPSRIVTLFSPEGQSVQVVLPDQEDTYYTLLSQGYTVQQTTPQPIETPAVVQPSGDTGGGGGGGGYVTPSGQPARDLTELTTEELRNDLNRLDGIGRLGAGLATAINPLFGLAARGALGSSRANIVQELESRGEDMSDYRENNGRGIYGGGLNMYDGLTDVNQDGEINFGDTWFGDLIGRDGRAGVQGPTLRESREGARRSFPTGGGGGAAPRDSGGGDSGTSRAPASSPAPTARPSAPATGSGYAAPSSSTGAGGSGAISAEDVSWVNKGGFITRRNKK
jgi:hypothetical protein